MWTGSIESLYPGWALCDGDNGTPDLRDLFIMQHSVSHPLDETGGADAHDHAFTSNTHNHTIGVGGAILPMTNYNTITDNKQVTGTTNVTNALPPYYALAFVMKL